MVYTSSFASGALPIVPVFLEHSSDRVTGIAVHCDGVVLPIDSISTLHRHARRRHELVWLLLPALALAAFGWTSAAAAMALLTAIAWWRLPPVHVLDLTLRDGQRLCLVASYKLHRVNALHQALADALAHRWEQKETQTQVQLDATRQTQGSALDRPWRNTSFDEIYDRSPGAVTGARRVDIDIPL